jgi:hypothetical protein
MIAHLRPRTPNHVALPLSPSPLVVWPISVVEHKPLGPLASDPLALLASYSLTLNPLAHWSSCPCKPPGLLAPSPLAPRQPKPLRS